MVVKEEKVEANTSVLEETEEDVRLIGDDGEFSTPTDFLAREAVKHGKMMFVQIPVTPSFLI